MADDVRTVATLVHAHCESHPAATRGSKFLPVTILSALGQSVLRPTAGSASGNKQNPYRDWETPGPALVRNEVSGRIVV